RTVSGKASGAISAILILLLVGCSTAGTPASSSATPQPAPSGPAHITAAVTGNPPGLYNKIADPAIAGVAALEALVNVGLTIQDHAGVSRARLAESLPSVENGLWTLAPDGSMETTWKIRPGAKWHDGVPLDAQDLLFTA